MSNDLPPGFIIQESSDLPAGFQLESDLPPGFVIEPPKKKQPIPRIGQIEAGARGFGHGAWQQPRDVIAAGYAHLFGDIPFKEALAQANEMSLEGRQGAAQQQHPNTFGAGQIAGNIATSAGPAGMAVKGLSGTAAAMNAPRIASAIRGTGMMGVPTRGAIEGSVQGLMADGDAAGGAAAGAAGSTAMGILGKVAKPISSALNPEQARLARVAAQEGLSLSPAQKTGSQALKNTDAALRQLPFSAGAMGKIDDGQAQAFTRAVLKRAGIDSDSASPDVLKAAEQKLGQQFRNLSAQTRVDLSNMDQVLKDVEQKAARRLGPDTRQVLLNFVEDIRATGKNMPGEIYQQTRSDLSNLARSYSNTDTFTAGLLRKLRDELDSAASDSMPTHLKDAWGDTRSQYGALKTVMKAMSGAGEEAAGGTIPAKQLRTAVKSQVKDRYATGAGDLNDLSRIGQSFLRDQPNSGTAQRIMMQNLLTGGAVSGGMGLAAGTTTYGMTQDPTSAITAGIAGMAGPRLAQALMHSKAGQRYLTEGIPYASKLASQKARTLAALLAAAPKQSNPQGAQ